MSSYFNKFELNGTSALLIEATDLLLQLFVQFK